MISRRSFITRTGALLASAQAPAQTVGKTLNEADVIVVGAGGAGLAAAVAAAEKGASVIVLEKMSAPGGNTLRSSGSFNAAIASANHDDSPQKHYLDTFRYGGCRAEPELVRTLTENAPEVLAWLKSQGVRFSEHVYQAFGGMHPRAHNTLAPFGAGYIEALLTRCRSLNVAILTDHQVLDFHKTSSNRVTAVSALHNGQKIDFAAHRAVVAASGGFAANNDMCSTYDPRVDRMPTTNHPGATGEVLRALENIGASLVGMDYIELAPVCLVGKDVFETVMDVIEYIENFLVNYSFKQGKFENKIIPCDIKELINKKIENYKYIFINKNIHIDIMLDNNSYNIETIPIFISSIIGNIISNIALHASKNQTALIELHRKNDFIYVDFKNLYDIQTNDFSLGLDFCRKLAQSTKSELKFCKTKNTVCVNLKIPRLKKI